MARSDLIKTERIQAKAHVYNFNLWPRLWDSFNRKYKHKYKWSKIIFKKTSKDKIPPKPGVYTFVVRPEIANHPSCSYLVYTGKSKNLRDRFNHYIGVQKGQRRHSARMEQGLEQFEGCSYLFFYYSLHPKKLIGKYEQALIDGLAPPWNDKKTISSEVGEIMRAF